MASSADEIPALPSYELLMFLLSIAAGGVVLTFSPLYIPLIPWSSERKPRARAWMDTQTDCGSGPRCLREPARITRGIARTG